jgi:hypothetical protein
MRLLALALASTALVACSGVPFSGRNDEADDFRVPLVCLPKHEQPPCSRGVEQERAYEFNLQTHCGIEWAYFDGRFWVPKPKVRKPGHWASITAGAMVLERSDLATFTAADGGSARFAPAQRSFRPQPCM